VGGAPLCDFVPGISDFARVGAFNGWSLYAKDDKLKYCCNLLRIRLFHAETDRPLPAGQHQVRMEFKYDGGGRAKGGNAVLYVDREKVGEGRVQTTVPMMFSGGQTLTSAGEPALRFHLTTTRETMSSAAR
jgi:hypothetical protein